MTSVNICHLSNEKKVINCSSFDIDLERLKSWVKFQKYFFIVLEIVERILDMSESFNSWKILLNTSTSFHNTMLNI